MSTIYLELPVDTDEIIDGLRVFEEENFLLDVLERFNPKNIKAALREHFKDEYERVARVSGYVSYFEEQRTLLEILKRFDDHNVNAALREYFGLKTRNKLPDFVDAEKL